MAKQKAITIKSDKEIDFWAYGILTDDLADFQLAMAINQKMRWNLHRYLPLADAEAEPPFKFDFFGENNSSGHFQLALWKNWQNEQFFNSELKNIQFFIRITGEWGELQDKQLIKVLKEIVGSPNAIQIKVNKLKFPEFFMFQIMSREQLEEKNLRAKIRESNLS
jgi:hypothetical protein